MFRIESHTMVQLLIYWILFKPLLIILFAAYLVSAIVTNIEANVWQETTSSSLLSSGDGMDIDNDNMSNSSSHGMIWF